MHTNPKYIVIDLFCGAGGTTTGMAMAVDKDGKLITKVIAAVNHDPKAIKSHWRNHPEIIHFEEDIRKLDLTELIRLTNKYRALYPDAYIVLWASLECTNFSKAKGGKPRDADSRTLAEHLYRYIEALNPHYIMIENVVEFMSWGPLISKTTKTKEGYLYCPISITPVYGYDKDENIAADWVRDNSGLLIDKNRLGNEKQTGWRVNWQGIPEKKKNGSDWLKWREHINSYGYRDEWRELNSANYGAYTSRNRLFGCFAQGELPIIWPMATHAKKPIDTGLFGEGLKKWKAVKDVLDFKDEGRSIFDRETPLSDKTLERIYAGLIKFIAGGKTNFIAKYYSGRPEGKVISTEGPAGTIKTADGQSLVQPVFLAKYNSTNKNGQHNAPSIEEPCPTITTQNRLGVVKASFLTQRNNGKPEGRIMSVDGPARTLTATGGNQDIVSTQFLGAYHGNGDNMHSVHKPAPTIPTKDSLSLIQATHFINRDFTGGGYAQSIEQPAGSVMPSPKLNLVQVDKRFVMPTHFDNQPQSIEEPLSTITANRKWHYLVNPSWGGNPHSTDDPCPVIIARQDKAPMCLVVTERGELAIEIYDTDSNIMKQIKEFMALYGIVDIKMRMLKVMELKKIQGFPHDYILEGNQSDQKKFIGNSVVPHVVKAWIEAMAA